MNNDRKENIVEETIIGCLLTYENLINELYLQPKHFLNNNNKIIFSKILDLKKQKGKVDLVLLCESLNETYLQDLAMSYVENLVSIGEFHDYQEKQEVIYKAKAINLVMEKFNSKKITYDDMIEKVNKINGECNKNVDSSNSLASAKDIFEMITSNSNELKFETYSDMQNILKLPMHTVNLIAARTSQGKSALSLNFSNDLSKNYKCLYFNMEMTEKELYQRLVSINSNIPIESFYKINQLSEREKQLIWKGIEEVRKRRLKIYNGSKNIKALRTILTKESKNEHCIAFIDYIGYVYSTNNSQNDRERIGEVVREIKNMTADLDITVFLVAQINRSGDEEPSLVNLKDSGELEQTAHCVMIIHNPEKNNQNNQTPEIKLLVPKNRSGRLGSLKMIFDKPTQRFIPLKKE
jgi:replicative DNA helicase